MHTWQRLTAIATGVAALHGAALWAAHSYRVRTDATDTPPALVTRSLQVPASVEPVAASIPLPASMPPVPPKSVTTRATKNKSADNPATSAANAPAPVTAAAPSARAELSLATNSAKPDATASAGKTAASNSSGADFTTAQSAVASPSETAAANVPQKIAGTPAEALNLVRPAYTQLTQRLDQTGRVQIAFEVNVDGNTVNARVAQSSGFNNLDAAALDAARKTRYKPAVCGDKKVPSKYTRNYAFGIDALPDPPQPLIDCSGP